MKRRIDTTAWYLLRPSLAMVLLWLGASGATMAATAPCSTDTPVLQLGSSVVTLPAGMVGEPYRYALYATGGVPPYTFQAGSLPPGFTLNNAGELNVAPSDLPLIAVFTASVHDHRGCSAEQTYRLVITPSRPAPAPRPAEPVKPIPLKPVVPKKPEGPEPLVTVPLSDTLAEPSAPQPGMDTYVLTQAIFEDKDVVAALKQMSAHATVANDLAPAEEPDADDADDAPAKDEPATQGDDKADASDAIDVKTQFQRMLQPLIGVEYPGRDLFAAALDNRLCRFSEALILAAARKQGKKAPSMGELDCPPDWAKLAKQDNFMPRDPLPWKEVPLWLMSPGMHELLIQKAEQVHPLLDPPAPLWDGRGCGCVRKMHGDTYGFFPFWQTQGKPQLLDFSLITRIELFALWFNESGELAVPAWVTPQQTAFIREARRHRNWLDYTLYRNDWRFLKDLPSSDVGRVTAQLATQAADFIDAPLPDWISRSHAWVPGFAKVERVGDGLTLFLDHMPAANDPLRPAFSTYLDQQVLALIAELRRRDRDYVLNIVLRDSDIGSAWQVSAIYEYMKQAESPPIRDGHVIIGSTQYRSHTNLTLRYLILMTEPTPRSRLSIRQALEQDKKLNGDDRRVLLGKLVPIVSSGSANERELADEMAYVADNFGGIGFWTSPDRVQPVGKMVSSTLGAGFLSAAPKAEPFLAWVCEFRWPLRMIFEALLLLWLIAFVFYQASCRLRRFGLPFQLALLIGAIAILLLGAVLLAGDPSLTKIREGNALLGVLLVALLASIAYQMLKPRVEKP